jgi:hypothetical protein
LVGPQPNSRTLTDANGATPASKSRTFSQNATSHLEKSSQALEAEKSGSAARLSVTWPLRPGHAMLGVARRRPHAVLSAGKMKKNPLAGLDTGSAQLLTACPALGLRRTLLASGFRSGLQGVSIHAAGDL